MEIQRYFLSILFPLRSVSLLAVPLLSLLFAQSASAAYMKYTYQTPIMNLISEQSYDDEGFPPGRDLFWNATEQFTITMILPEIKYELEEMEGFYKVFSSPVISVTGSNFFNVINIDSSTFILEAWKEDGVIYHNWWLSFFVSDTNYPGDMERRASFTSTGSLNSMILYQDNYYARGCAGQYPPEWQMGCWEGVFDSVVEFEGDYMDLPGGEYPGGIYWMSGYKISVSEPLTPMLFLTGLAGLFMSRRLALKNSESNTRIS